MRLHDVIPASPALNLDSFFSCLAVIKMAKKYALRHRWPRFAGLPQTSTGLFAIHPSKFHTRGPTILQSCEAICPIGYRGSLSLPIMQLCAHAHRAQFLHDGNPSSGDDFGGAEDEEPE